MEGQLCTMTASRAIAEMSRARNGSRLHRMQASTTHLCDVFMTFLLTKFFS
jgi:hypothetical protein